MSYKEGITINGKHSYVDFDLTISSRKIDLPPKNSIRKTVPYMSGFYDFTTLNGAATFGEREISYTFDIVGDTVEAMDRKRTEVVNWFCNLHDVDIYDDTIPDYHFHGSYESQSQNEDGEKTELTITFVCHPFLIKNEPTQMVFNSQRADTIYYDGQPVVLYGKGKATIKTGGYVSTLDSAEMIDTGLVLTAGNKQIEVIPTELAIQPFYDLAVYGGTKTYMGVTFVDSKDGKITANGTSTGQSVYYVKQQTLPAGRYWLSGCPAGGVAGKWRLVANNVSQGNNRLADDTGSGKYFTLTEASDVMVIAVVDSGNTVANLVFEPSLAQVTTLEYSEEVL